MGEGRLGGGVMVGRGGGVGAVHICHRGPEGGDAGVRGEARPELHPPLRARQTVAEGGLNPPTPDGGVGVCVE